MKAVRQELAPAGLLSFVSYREISVGWHGKTLNEEA
jgi:hypothetical protein